MRNCATGIFFVSFFLKDMGLMRTWCNSLWGEISHCIVNSRKTTTILGMDRLRLEDERRWTITLPHTRTPESSASMLQQPLAKVCVPLSEGSAAFCLLVMDGDGPFLSGIMSRAELEGETLRFSHIKPSDCHYCLFYPTFTAPPLPSLSSFSCAGVKTSFQGLHDKWKWENERKEDQRGRAEEEGENEKWFWSALPH